MNEVRKRPGKHPPEKVEMLAMMLATGRFTTAQICDLLGCSGGWINTMRRNPLFMENVRKFQKQVYHSIVDAALSDLMADAQNTTDFMMKVRDGEVSDDPAALNVRVRAASWLGDRQIPKPRSEDETGGVKIIINADTQSRFDAADKEVAEIIETEAEEMPE